jgi:ketosteroid isomerase-like protein
MPHRCSPPWAGDGPRDVSRWLADAAWRAPGTDRVAEIFTEDAAYLNSPYAEPVAGLDAIRRMWDEDRDGPDEGGVASASERGPREARRRSELRSMKPLGW